MCIIEESQIDSKSNIGHLKDHMTTLHRNTGYLMLKYIQIIGAKPRKFLVPTYKICSYLDQAKFLGKIHIQFSLTMMLHFHIKK